jgi:hypothetical protein
MSGLAVLSFVISQLHKVIDFMERRKQKDSVDTSAAVSIAEEAAVSVAEERDFSLDHPLTDLQEAAQHYRRITQELGDRFELKDLYSIFHTQGFPHPHITIRSLKDSGFLVPTGDSYFKWKV